MSPSSLTWDLGPLAWDPLGRLRQQLGDVGYRRQREAFQRFLCAYFVSGAQDCTHKLWPSISPLGGGGDGWKRLKVRWGLPGQGKSGGLRLAVAVHCEGLRVIIAGVWMRRDDPGDDVFASSFETAGA